MVSWMALSAAPMKPIPLDSIPREGLKINLILDREWLREQIRSRELGFEPVGPVTLQGELYQANQELFFRGRLAAVLRLTCGRCLEEFSAELTGPLERQWRTVAGSPGKPGRASGEALEIEDLETGGIQHGGLDLAETALEQLILTLPMRPLCREDCRGLCPVCGGNRNQASCSCRDGDGDHPFKDLKKLRL